MNDFQKIGNMNVPLDHMNLEPGIFSGSQKQEMSLGKEQAFAWVLN